MRSRLYRGRVRHTRRTGKGHAFQYQLQLFAIDLDELPELVRRRWFWSSDGFNLVQFRRADYFGPPEIPLREAVLDRVEAALGHRPQGSLQVLTQLRSCGYLFNPVSFYFCRSARGELEAILAEITNTPWGERHAYVMDCTRSKAGDEECSFEFQKEFHISPFFDMDQDYRWSFALQGDQLRIRMANFEGARCVFEVQLEAKSQELTGRSMSVALLRAPLQPLRLHLAIYWQALLLHLKQTPFHPHPKKRLEA